MDQYRYKPCIICMDVFYTSSYTIIEWLALIILYNLLSQFSCPCNPHSHLTTNALVLGGCVIPTLLCFFLLKIFVMNPAHLGIALGNLLLAPPLMCYAILCPPILWHYGVNLASRLHNTFPLSSSLAPYPNLCCYPT